MKNRLWRKGLVVVIVLFVSTSFISSIGGYSEEVDQIDTDVADVCGLQEDVIVTCRTFGFPGESFQEIVMSLDEAEFLYSKIGDLQIEIACDPLSDKIQQLQHEVITFADEHSLLPAGVSEDALQSCLYPSWMPQNRRLGILPFLQSRGSEFLCTFVSTGSGAALPVIALPRFIPIIMIPIPRIVMWWRAQEALTSCGGLRSGTGFIAYGQQDGLALGFWGIGFTFSLPPFMGMYGLIGYALFAKVNAEDIEFYPPNSPPVISCENPPSGTQDIPVSLSELSFKIEDSDGDLMSYSVTTEPYIGSGSGNNKKNGFYTIAVSGLEYDKIYRWTVSVTDGKDTTEKQFSFITEEKPPFDPFDEGWQYRKKITVDHTLVAVDLSNFPLLISTIDFDMRDKAQSDGDDILFMDGDGVANKLYYEIEEFDGSSGELIAWVKIPSVSSVEDTVLYVYYGNAGSSSQQFPERVWDSNFVMVHHMNGVDWSSIDDSTSYDNDVYGTYQTGNPGYNAIGKIGKCVDFNGNCMLLLPASTSYSSLSDVTLECWVEPHDLTNLHGGLICKRFDQYPSHQGWILKIDIEKNGRYLMYKDETENDWSLGDSQYSIEDWHHAVVTIDSSGNLKFFKNGSSDGSDTGQNYPTDTVNALSIGGWDKFNDRFCDGKIDEVRISKTARSTEWISTSYNNQNDPLGFLSFGPEETGP